MVEEDADWRNVSIFHLHDCHEIQVELNQGSGSIATALEKSILIVEDVDMLDLTDFQAGLAGVGSDLDEETVRITSGGGH